MFSSPLTTLIELVTEEHDPWVDPAENLTVAALFPNGNLGWSGGMPLRKMFENQYLERNCSKWEKSYHDCPFGTISVLGRT